ncbi:MAG TPA: sensor domain-containing protein [Nocardioidaceae bacterium]|nr:sensor domain-containing protein [Nocardioidaceae bacterium]
MTQTFHDETSLGAAHSTVHSTADGVPAPSAPRGRIERFGRDNAYLLSALPLTTAVFTAVVVTTSVSAVLIGIAVGLPLLALSLSLARGLSSIERLRLRALGMHVSDAAPVARRAGWRGHLDAVGDRASWRAVLHAVVTFPIAITTWSMAIGWWAAALGGLSYPLWRGTLPDGPDDNNLAELLGFTSTHADVVLNLGIGIAFAVTLVPAIRALAGVQSGVSRAILAPELVGNPGAR